MTTALVWPDTVEALFELLDGTEHAGHPIKLIEEEPPPIPDQAELGADQPVVVVNLDDSAIGEIDRVDKFRLEVHAHGRALARTVAESITALVCVEGGWETPSALIDLAEHRTGPAVVPHPSQNVRKVAVTFWLTTRPL
ncbi:hypothetical protein Q7C18_07435 [Nesterenkonia sp. CL21]|uniref:hypothetical protein n=1 Tax=Nesterenkonia sp. CL21 TaxID=3064894 RepID=UPI002879E0F3|nr:hypothetical protein [Nesterenkonia sp. CL21]MDS2172521.1 hypothetical protein [Nesterenkonia sp. CL21]